MNDKELLNRIVIDPKVMVGKPVIKGTRLTVQYILSLLSQGMTTEEITEKYKIQRKNTSLLVWFLYKRPKSVYTTR